MQARVLERLLKTGAFDDAQQQIQQMREQQLYIAPFALTQFFRLACEAERVNECLNVLEDRLTVSGHVPIQSTNSMHKSISKGASFN